MIIEWLPEAAADRFDQVEYIAKDNPIAAISQDEEIEKQVDALAGTPPISGRIGRKPGTRELVISHTSFIAVFRVKKNTIQILRLLHSSQLWPPVKK